MTKGPPVASCTECGRPLLDPESIRVGIGPVCRERLGIESGGSVGGGSPCAVADYSHSIIDDVLVIRDRNRGGRNVTNDMERVLADLAQTVDLKDRVVIYRDSMGRYDGVEHHNGLFVRFYSIGGHKARTAIDSAVVIERRRKAKQRRAAL